MENIYYLEIDLFDEESGVQCISFVDNPATEVTYQLFADVDAEDKAYKKWLNELIPLLDDSGVTEEELKDKPKEKEEEIIKYFRYERNSAVKSKGGESRDFCSAMSNFKLYTKEEIEKLSNPGFGPNGSDKYDIFKYRGGLNCQHKWVAYDYNTKDKSLKKSKDQPEQPTPVPAYSKEGEKRQAKFSVENNRQIIMSPVMLAETLIPRKFNDYIYYVKFSANTIENMMKKVMMEGKQHNINMYHEEDNIIDGVFMVESFIYDKRMKLENFENVPEGSWIASYYVPSKEQYDELVNNPNFNGFSLEGNFNHVSAEDLVQTILGDPDLSEDNKISQIKNILNI